MIFLRPKAIDVKPLKNYMLEITFNNGEKKQFDVKPYMKFKVFKELENIWNIIHTGVDRKYQGQGIAKRLVKCVIENSKECNKKVIAECSYAKKILETEIESK